MKTRTLDSDGCAVRRIDAGRVLATRRRLITHDEASRLAELYRLLGDATRTRMLFALLEAGELCVCDIAATVDAPETSVSHALRLLRTAGVVRARRAGRVIYYSLDDAHVRLLLDLSREHVRHGDEGETSGPPAAGPARTAGAGRRRRR
jgi:DNA-binding transcriptional ArsR family regulator